MLPRFTLFVFLIFLLVACASPSSSPSSPSSPNSLGGNQPPLPSPATNEIFTPRYKHQALNFDDKIWVIGGVIVKDATAVIFNDVWFSSDGRLGSRLLLMLTGSLELFLALLFLIIKCG